MLNFIEHDYCTIGRARDESFNVFMQGLCVFQVPQTEIYYCANLSIMTDKFSGKRAENAMAKVSK